MKYARYPVVKKIVMNCAHCKKDMGTHEIHFSKIYGMPSWKDLPEDVFASSGCLKNGNLIFWCYDCKPNYRSPTSVLQIR